MRVMIRFLVAFCVATVLAQAIILAMAGVRGNLHKDTLVKAIALLNGVDISGEHIQNILDEHKNNPAPRYEDVKRERARTSVDLQMLEKSVAQSKLEITEMLEENKAIEKALNGRVEEVHALLDREKEDLLEESLQEVKRTLESIQPEQAKTQLLMFDEQNETDVVIAILKAMPMEKRRKILGEFNGPKESEQLNKFLRLMLEGEPVSTRLDEARQRVTQ